MVNQSGFFFFLSFLISCKHVIEMLISYFFYFFQVYDGLRYKLVFDFPSGYPYQAPVVKFESACYHPNVDEHGNICLDILKENWSALYDVRTVLLSIQSLLGGMVV